jgi:hypothetical protein
MDTYLLYEIIGYVASVLIAVSLMMSAIIKLRVINLIGAATFAVYGVLIGSAPVAIMNSFIVLINIYFLYQIFTSPEYFKLLKLIPGSRYLNYYIDFYKQDILKTQPNFVFEPNDQTLAVFILRDMVPAGILMGQLQEDGTLNIQLDYVTANYRDFKIGKFLYNNNEAFFKNVGVSRFVSQAAEPIHNKYLERMGFVRKGDVYEFSLA